MSNKIDLAQIDVLVKIKQIKTLLNLAVPESKQSDILEYLLSLKMGKGPRTSDNGWISFNRASRGVVYRQLLYQDPKHPNKNVLLQTFYLWILYCHKSQCNYH